MKSSIFFLLIIFGFYFSCKSQYYYNDIISSQLSQKEYLLLKTNHIHRVSAISYESDGQPTEDFSLVQDISPEAKTITLNSSYPSSGNTTSISTYKFNKLIETVENTSKVSNTIHYQYDSAGKIISIVTITQDTFMNSRSEELHQWFYKNDVPEKMLRIKDNNDTTLIEFTYDDAGNIGQENWKRKNTVVETYYYYYNSKKQLTDIVRYNAHAKEMLPDFLFEYDNNDHITQMTQVPPGSSDYMIWKYTYNSNGLKKSEFLFDKEKQLVGHIDYTYE